jgi:hypothetical protein
VAPVRVTVPFPVLISAAYGEDDVETAIAENQTILHSAIHRAEAILNNCLNL